jgi:acyl-CoA synthetase (NDP forming)
VFRILLGVVLSGLPVVAQSKAPGSAAHQPTKAKAPAAKGSQQDKALEATIRAKLAKSKIKKDGFTVRVQGGVAYWEGATSVIQHKGSATRMAKAAGAKAVVNNIKISDAARQKATQNLDQGRRRKSSAASRGRSGNPAPQRVYTFVLR